MVELTMFVSGVDEERTIEGSVANSDPLVISESHENRPDWRVESDGTVTLISAKTGTEIDGYADMVSVDGYCRSHGIVVERVVGHDRCPRCRMENGIRAMEREMIERRANPDMHPSVDARRR